MTYRTIRLPQLAAWAPIREREAIERKLERMAPDQQVAALEMLATIQGARSATAEKRAADRITDARRRTLVGARLPRSVAERVRAAAAADGISCYEWVGRAIVAALREAEAPPWDTSPE